MKYFVNASPLHFRKASAVRLLVIIAQRQLIDAAIRIFRAEIRFHSSVLHFRPADCASSADFARVYTRHVQTARAKENVPSLSLPLSRLLSLRRIVPRRRKGCFCVLSLAPSSRSFTRCPLSPYVSLFCPVYEPPSKREKNEILTIKGVFVADVVRVSIYFPSLSFAICLSLSFFSICAPPRSVSLRVHS